MRNAFGVVPHGPRVVPASRAAALTAVEIALATALATGAVGALQHTAPANGLGVVYLPAVLAVAIRRGQLAAILTALISTLVLNYLFIAPRHQLAIAHSQDVVELAVLLIAAVVVGRLAAAVRSQAAEADRRAEVAARREREAALLAQSASAILGGPSLGKALEQVGAQLSRATAASRARIVPEPVPAPAADELTLPLPTRSRSAWLYISADTGWGMEDLERLAAPLGRLIDVAVERERLNELSAEREAATRADGARTAILHAISHDLRSPLTAITTAGSALGAAGLTPGEHRELTDVIEIEGARLARLVDDLLDLSRIEAGAVAPRADWCDLADIVASALAGLSTEHAVEFSIPDELPLVHADAAQLERVFSNLIENAIKFSPADAPVRVSAGIGGGRVTVRVLDTGRGIPIQHRARVFEPFFRGRRDGPPGSGLGLAICRGFVQANGGEITLQSTAETGTAFAVSFTVTAQPLALS